MRGILSRPTAFNFLLIIATTLCGQSVFSHTVGETNLNNIPTTVGSVDAVCHGGLKGAISRSEIAIINANDINGVGVEEKANDLFPADFSCCNSQLHVANIKFRKIVFLEAQNNIVGNRTLLLNYSPCAPPVTERVCGSSEAFMNNQSQTTTNATTYTTTVGGIVSSIFPVPSNDATGIVVYSNVHDLKTTAGEQLQGDKKFNQSMEVIL